MDRMASLLHQNVQERGLQQDTAVHAHFLGSFVEDQPDQCKVYWHPKQHTQPGVPKEERAKKCHLAKVVKISRLLIFLFNKIARRGIFTASKKNFFSFPISIGIL